MPNHAYNRGAAYERELVGLKRQEGFVATRSGGSHTPIDVWAAKDGELFFYQLKSGRRRWPSRDERFALASDADRARATAFIVFREPNKGFEFVPRSEWPA